MDYRRIFKLGFKILVAAAAGLAVFAGIDGKLGGKKKSDNSVDNSEGRQTESRQQGENWRTGGGISGEYVSMDVDWKKEASRPIVKSDDGAIQSLKNIQGTLGKLLTFAQSLTLLAQSFKRVFSDSSDDCGEFYNNFGYNRFYDPWRQQPSTYYSQDGVIFNRLSPFVTEVEFDNRYYQGRY